MDESWLAKIHPTFTYSWEEETGWGGWMRYEDGVCVEQNSFECPNWYEDDFDFYIDKLGIVKVEEDISPMESILMTREESFLLSMITMENNGNF